MKRCDKTFKTSIRAESHLMQYLCINRPLFFFLYVFFFFFFFLCVCVCMCVCVCGGGGGGGAAVIYHTQTLVGSMSRVYMVQI